MQKRHISDKSLVVQNIQNHLDSIRPSVIKAQLESIDAASEFYKDKLSSYKLAINKYKNEFVVQPDIIKGFEDIQQRKLELNDESLASLIKAQELFRLELAQNTAPWTLFLLL